MLLCLLTLCYIIRVNQTYIDASVKIKAYREYKTARKIKQLKDKTTEKKKADHTPGNLLWTKSCVYSWTPATQRKASSQCHTHASLPQCIPRSEC